MRGYADRWTSTPRYDRTLLELRERGLSHAAISIVFDLYEGVELTAEQVRRRLEALGAPKNPNMVRPVRARDELTRVDDMSWPSWLPKPRVIA